MVHDSLEIDNDIETKKLALSKKKGRTIAMCYALYGEFMCTLIFFTVLFSAIGTCVFNGYSPAITNLVGAITAGLNCIAMIYTFSSVSGAHFNCNISFSLWLTGKLSNRRLFLYLFIQLIASVLAMGITMLMYKGDVDLLYSALAATPLPSDDKLQIFLTEFATTFILTYIIFFVVLEESESEKHNNMSFIEIQNTKGLSLYASTPQSKTGFAPFAIGFIVFTLSLCGAYFNQIRLFGPSLLSGKWDYWYIYYSGEILGSSLGALLVHNSSKFYKNILNVNNLEEKKSSASILVKVQGKQNENNSLSNLEANPLHDN